jgi:hypothetical protein
LYERPIGKVIPDRSRRKITVCGRDEPNDDFPGAPFADALHLLLRERGARRLIIIELAANLREDLDTGRTRPIVRRSEVEL